MSQPTIKVTLQGPPHMVEAVSRQMKEFLEVPYISRNARLSTNPNHVRRVLRVQPMKLSGQTEDVSMDGGQND